MGMEGKDTRGNRADSKNGEENQNLLRKEEQEGS
jgi:hypothetical protein